MDDLIALLYLAVVDEEAASSLQDASRLSFEAGAATGSTSGGPSERPHVQRVGVSNADAAVRQPQLVGSMVEAALDLIPHPAFLTDEYGRIRHANGAGASAACGPRRAIVERSARCAGATPGHRGCGEGGVGGTILAQGSVVTAGRLPDSLAPPAEGPGLALVVVRPLVEDRGELSRRCVLALGLTAAEADVVAGIAAGETPAAVAAGRGVGVATVRTLIRRALDKTGCEGLRELTGLVLRLPAGPF